MSRRRHTPEQIITALREAEVGLANGKGVAIGNVSEIYGQATHWGEGAILAATGADRLEQARLARSGVLTHDLHRGVLWIDDNRKFSSCVGADGINYSR